MNTEDRIRKSLGIASHLAPEPPPIRREPRQRHSLAVVLAVAAVVAAVAVPVSIVGMSHRQGAAPVTDQPSSTSAPATAVPWLDKAGRAPAFTGGPPTARPCLLADLSTPARLQKWGGIWQGADSGYFEIENSSSTMCQLDFPSQVTATTPSGVRHVVFKKFENEWYVLPPGARIQVQITSAPGCGQATRASSISLTIPAGELVVSPAPMHLDCRPELISFVAPRALMEMLTPASSLEATIEGAPATGFRDNVITYQVTLTNPGSEPVAFTECPVYQEGLKDYPDSQAIYVLNCKDHPFIEAGSSMTYEMQLSIPGYALQASAISKSSSVVVYPTPSPVQAYLQWHLLVPTDPANPRRYASVPITIE